MNPVRVCADPNNLPFSNRDGRRLREQACRVRRREAPRARRLYLVGATARLHPQHVEGGGLRRRDGRARHARHGRDHTPVLPLQLCLRVESGPALCAAFDQGRTSEEPRDRRPADRRRRIQHAARPCAERAGDRQQRCRLYRLRRLSAIRSAGAHRRGGREGRHRRRRGVGPARGLFRAALAGSAQRDADQRHRAVQPAAVPVRHRHRRPQRRPCPQGRDRRRARPSSGGDHTVCWKSTGSRLRTATKPPPQRAD